jgi:hypothetical protein
VPSRSSGSLSGNRSTITTPVMTIGSRLSRQEVGRKKGDKEAEWAGRSQEKEVEVEVEECRFRK